MPDPPRTSRVPTNTLALDPNLLLGKLNLGVCKSEYVTPPSPSTLAVSCPGKGAQSALVCRTSVRWGESVGQKKWGENAANPWWVVFDAMRHSLPRGVGRILPMSGKHARMLARLSVPENEQIILQSKLCISLRRGSLESTF